MPNHNTIVFKMYCIFGVLQPATLNPCIFIASFPGSPVRVRFSILQVTESWTGPGNEASIFSVE